MQVSAREEVIENLEKALATEDPNEKNFYIRQALQLLEVKSGTE